MDTFPLKINIVVTDFVNDVTYSRKSVNTRVVITLLLHDVIHWKTATSYDNWPYTNKTKTISVYSVFSLKISVSIEW